MEKIEIKSSPYEEGVTDQLKNISDALVFLCNDLTDEAYQESETEYDEFIRALSLYGRIDYYIGTLNLISDKIISIIKQEKPI